MEYKSRNFLCLLFLAGFYVGALSRQGMAEERLQLNSFLPQVQERAIEAREKLENILKLRGKAHRWEHIVRGFRKDHHFTMIAGGTQGKWSVRQNKDAARESYSSIGAELKARYTFHVPLFESFGYFLGTSFGAQMDSEMVRDVKAPDILKFPGMTGGFAWNLSPVLRLNAGSELYLERWDDLAFDASTIDRASVTTRVLGFFISLDIFYELYWAMSLEIGTRHNHYIRPTKSSQHIVGADLSKDEHIASFGIVYHLM